MMCEDMNQNNKATINGCVSHWFMCAGEDNSKIGK